MDETRKKPTLASESKKGEVISQAGCRWKNKETGRPTPVLTKAEAGKWRYEFIWRRTCSLVASSI